MCIHDHGTCYFIYFLQNNNQEAFQITKSNFFPKLKNNIEFFKAIFYIHYTSKNIVALIELGKINDSRKVYHFVYIYV